jgi:hypothetical protein
LDYFTVNAGPTFRTAAASRARFFFRTISLTIPGLTFGLSRLHNLSVDAAPDLWPFARSDCFFSGAVTLGAGHTGLRLRFWDLDDFSVNAAPPRSCSSAASLCFFSGIETLEFARLRLGRA